MVASFRGFGVSLVAIFTLKCRVVFDEKKKLSSDSFFFSKSLEKLKTNLSTKYILNVVFTTRHRVQLGDRLVEEVPGPVLRPHHGVILGKIHLATYAGSKLH